MSNFRLVGVTWPDDARRLLQANAPLRAAQAIVVDACGLTALLIPAKKPLAKWLQTRKAEMNDLLAFQKLLEGVSADAALLPAAYGSALLESDQALALLTTHAAALHDELTAYGALVQFQVEVRWDPVKAMAALRADGRMAGLDLSLANRDRAAFGAALQALMEAERINLGSRFHDLLTSAAREIIRLPMADETMLLNAAALIDRFEETMLDRAVEAIDAAMPEALSIRYLGPLPAVSFANITIVEPDAAALKQARAALGVSATDPADAVKSAFRLAIKRAHPDAASTIETADVAAGLAKAHALALRAALAPRNAKGLPLLLDIRREGDATARQAA
jgi:DnaJ-domain-containing protein 1